MVVIFITSIYMVLMMSPCAPLVCGMVMEYNESGVFDN